ncbi:MAG: rod shape-determining protein MreC [Desulfovibrionaceae bacterium]|nr:rod shape-determining protein MreC [Desulfovibrionaceae bacterium]
MSFRKILLTAGMLLILFLGMYSWNYATHTLDDLATDTGLEAAGMVLTPVHSLQTFFSELWTRYVDLAAVREENETLKKHISELEAKLLAHGEDMAELKRLRALLQLPVDASWRSLGARVLAGRIGPNAVLDTITINRGYATGGKPGTPLVTNKGLAGRVLRASAHTASVLLMTDPGSRVAVFTQESRAMGILRGSGATKPLALEFVPRDAGVKIGEMIVTSGLDGAYPKGLPCAKIVKVEPSNYTEFLAIQAEPLVDLQHLEEVLLLEQTKMPPYVEELEMSPKQFVGPPEPKSRRKP